MLTSAITRMNLEHILLSFSRSVASDSATPRTAARQASLAFTISRSSLRLMSVKLVMPTNHLVLCHPLLLLSSIFASIMVFTSDSALQIRWPKYWSFSINISPSSEHSGLIFFMMDCFDLLAVQGTRKSLLQHHSSKVSILWHPVFMVQTLTSVHDHWKNHRFDYMDLCWQNDAPDF